MLEGEDMVKVAIVEDDEIILEELSNCLKEWNFEVNKVDVAKDILQQLTTVIVISYCWMFIYPI